jgi:hypothetical protein
MASVIDITVTSDAWVDVYTETGIAVGTALVLQNKGASKIISQEADSEPDADATAGFKIHGEDSYWAKAEIDSGSSYIWLKVDKSGQTCSVAVQEDS